MKLNHDCVRDLMLFIEDNLDMGFYMDISKIAIPSYENQELLYTALKLQEAGYLTTDISRFLDGKTNVRVLEITWEGHKFLDTIRDNKVWSQTKSVLSKVSSASITFASSVASQVLTNLITQSLSGQSFT